MSTLLCIDVLCPLDLGVGQASMTTRLAIELRRWEVLYGW